MAHDVLHRLHFFYWNRVALEVEEVAQEYLALLLVNLRSESLELLIASQTCGELQSGYRDRVPRMFHSILAIGEKAHMRQQT